MIPGLENVTYLTNETIFTLTKLPSRLGIIGAGPIGSEMSQAFARLGSCVSLFEMTDHVLPREDPDAAEIVQKSMEADGIDLQLATNVIRVEQDGTKISVHFERLGEIYVQTFDQLLVTVGRAPNTENLGLEAAGIECGPEGVTINDRLQTTNSKVFACGDVASAHKFTHVADAQARIVIKNALFFGRSHSSELVVPWCTHTSPEIAHVGLYEQDALDLGYKVDTLTVPFSEVDRALLEGEEDGFLRVHLKKGSDRILGATMVAAHAGDMIGELCLAITARVGFAKIAATIHPYPTQAEVIKKAADKWRRKKLTPTVKQLFEFWFRIFS
jgi:pyruvate/2-oxoglutarate dehydrogenase complex dihydrolipoamide dehydrogenase (E3) component